ncbi:histone-like nucleoid-structuring protein Lsr2 [Pseudonocardia sp. RS010]|uniref:histone-like nucleoid-structuring protein Lsr2 n=1 Tax=Pseudonocardia sp. RS010 TaxID=3385979 RepID=UPI0039A221F5
MARQLQTTLIDDIDGGPADETVRFSLDGHHYEIDLASVKSEALRATLTPYVAAGRPQKTTPKAPRRAASGADRERNRAIREWARSQGLQIAARGRIPDEVAIRYEHLAVRS